jgi:hypothetical protein
MPDAYVIEVQGVTVGIVARDGDAYRFYASLRLFNSLEGKKFATPRLAERAAGALLRKRRGSLREAASIELAAA